MKTGEQQPQTEIKRSPDAIPGGEIWSERLTKLFEERMHIARMRGYSKSEELERKGIGAKTAWVEKPDSEQRYQQIDGIIEAGQKAFSQLTAAIKQVRKDREEGARKMVDQISTKEREIVQIQNSGLPKEEKQKQVQQKIEELQGLAQELPISLGKKDEIRNALDSARAAVEIKEVEEPLIKGVQAVLKYIESETLLDERDEDLEMWKNRNLVQVEQLKMLYGGRFPDSLPAHLGFLLMNMDTRLDHARSTVGRRDTFQFALKRYSTLVNHFGELVEEAAARVEDEMPGMIERVLGLLHEKQRIQGSLTQVKDAQKDVAKTRIDEISMEAAELQGRLRASVADHIRQLPPPEAELIPHKFSQWGPYATEEEAKSAIQALLNVKLPDTIWLEELGQVKGLVDFYEKRKLRLPEEMQLKIENKIRYFRLKFILLRDKLVEEGVLSGEMANLKIGDAPAHEEQELDEVPDDTQIEPTPSEPNGQEPDTLNTEQKESTQPNMTGSTLESDEIGIDEKTPHEPGQIVYVHRPTGERFIIDTSYNQVVLPSPPQMMISRDRLVSPIPGEDLQDPEKVEAAVELMLKRRNEEIRLMKDLISKGPFEVVQEVLVMPFSDFENKDQFTAEVGAYIKQEGIKAKVKALKNIHDAITNYLDELGYKAAADGRLVGEVISDSIKFRLST